jgi:hypothetical protein
MADTPITVTRAAISIAVPGTVSDRTGSVTTASFQADGKASTFAATVAIAAASLAPSPSVVNLDWEGDLLGISVATAAPTIVTNNVGGIASVARDPGTISLSGSDVALSLGATGSPRIAVDSTSLGFDGLDATLEKVTHFTNARFSLSPKNVLLSKDIPVVAASPSIAPQDITFSLSNTPVGEIEGARPTIAGQSIGLAVTWTLPVSNAGIDVSGAKTPLQVTIDNGVRIAEGEPFFTGQTFPLSVGIKVEAASPSITAYEVTRNWGTIVNADGEPQSFIAFAPGEIELSNTFTLGIEFDRAEVEVGGGDIDLYLGTGAPNEARIEHGGWQIYSALSNPITSATHGTS